MTGFSAGPHHDTGCIAINDGWHSEVPAPSARDLAAVNAAMPPMPTAAQQNDPKFMNEWRVRWHTAQANPVVALTNNRLDWLNGPGACVPESRHRLILSAVGLGALLFVTIGLSLGVRARKKPGAGLPWRDRSGAGTMRA